ncbi:MAG: hypothetical protein AAGF25_13500 [Pseudomonadota bacterium]
MAKKKINGKAQTRRILTRFGRDFLVPLGKEASTIPSYAMRELTGQPHDQKRKCTLKKGWFE